PPKDFLYYTDFIDACQNSLKQIASHAQQIGVIIGCPTRNAQPEGKDLFNSAYLLYEGKIADVVHKSLIPTYDVFDEYRYFEQADEWHVVHFKNKKIALTICEDLWNVCDNPMYKTSPMDQLISQNPDIMINLSASPFDYMHGIERKNILKENSKKYHLPLVYCNTVGAQTDIIFDGGSLAFDINQNIILEASYFQEEFAVLDLNSDGTFQQQSIITNEINHTTENQDAHYNIQKIYQALILGIKDYFEKLGFKKAIIGSSGGIDSAVVVALACKALGEENVLAVLMPSPYSSEHSVLDAQQLSINLKNPYQTLPIQHIFESFLNELKPIYKDLPFNVAEENIQARIRGNLLMAISNKHNYILLNTSNKSECAVGYGTLYGDMAGGLAVLGDVYKTQVYALAKYINLEKEIIPIHIIEKAPSAELRPNQKDSDSLPDYSILDAILYQYIEKNKSASELIAQGYEKELVLRVLNMVTRNEYKRNQFCPILRISPKSFGFGRQMPIVAKYLFK
ncbi:MAG: NAD+ synthase, partial [Chitinophagaceae bacterium]|nr:NAD+ synthase [Chitinophagaceae bacterium]